MLAHHNRAEEACGTFSVSLVTWSVWILGGLFFFFLWIKNSVPGRSNLSAQFYR